MGWLDTTFERDTAPPSGVRSGLLPGTRLATDMGWRPVEALAEGDRILTFDGGLRPLCGVTRVPLAPAFGRMPRDFWPLEIPAGIIGNRQALRLLPDQAVLVESDLAERLFDDPFALIRARDFYRLDGVAAVSPDPADMTVQLHFEREEIVFADHGLMFLCPAAQDLLAQVTGQTAPSGYALLREDLARDIVQDCAVRTLLQDATSREDRLRTGTV
jgi:hypothetical protein